jgi:hypothetical protein
MNNTHEQEMVQNLIRSLTAKGFQVYGPKKLTSYVYFTDVNNRIGYAQYSGVMGVEYTTVHKPSRFIGTGFAAKSAEEALSHAPSWATTSDRNAVVKYPDFETFRRGHWQKLVPYGQADTQEQPQP